MRALALSVLTAALAAQAPATHYPANASRTNESSFRKLEGLPTPNEYRAASGAPGHAYWQQKVDYKVHVALDDAKQEIRGSQEITYHNNSPDELRFLWVQLDQNLANPHAVGREGRGVADLAPSTEEAAERSRSAWTEGPQPGLTFESFRALTVHDKADGYHIEYVKDGAGAPLHWVVNDTMMRVDLAQPLKPGGVVKLQMGWRYFVNDYALLGGRSGFEQHEDGTRLYNIAQFQPRLAAYTDDMGWQHQQFLGQGEFTLEFGDWDVEVTLPHGMMMLATGELQNPDQVLTAEQRDRFAKARTSDRPVFIVKPDEAGKPASRPGGDAPLAWRFKAQNVRDFAFTAGHRLIWDAMGVKVNDRTVMAMSGYIKEGMPLWDKYSTEAVAHTLRTYGRYTFDYPYPVAISCLGLGIGGYGGMEYPMICFNGPRPEKDGTYSRRVKHGLVGVIIHEVGHNFFPMIVNSDERQWSWMDEGLNTFLQYLSEKEWDPEFPSSRGPVPAIVDYLKFPDATPIMTQSDAVRHFGDNAYGKPAAGLNMLRETIMGRELFDYAFKEYARRWRFKRPQPADFFRTMNDASGVDLDWFWRGWFFTTKAPDLALESVESFQVSDQEPEKMKARAREAAKKEDTYISKLRDKEQIPEGGVEKARGLQDFYSTYDPYAVTDADRKKQEAFLKSLKPEEKEALAYPKYLHRITVRNVGHFVMPVILKLTWADGTSEVQRVPVQAWLLNEERFSKLVVSDKALASVELDPFQEIPDVDRSNDAFPRKVQPPQMLLLKKKRPTPPNPMQEKGQEKGQEKPAQDTAGAKKAAEQGDREPKAEPKPQEPQVRDPKSQEPRPKK